MIQGRPCRCEKARAHRNLSLSYNKNHNADCLSGIFYVERKSGPTATAGEVRQLLEIYGRLDFCYTATALERTAFNVNEGVIVQFSLYDDGQNAFAVSHSKLNSSFNADSSQALRNDEDWKLLDIASMSNLGRVQSAQVVRNSSTEVDAARAYLSRYETDRRSIFVGNLPVGTTEEHIEGLFEHFGKINHINLREGVSKFGSKFSSPKFNIY